MNKQAYAVSAVLLFQLWYASAAAGPKLIHAGPMIGHVSDTTANIWIRTKAGARIKADVVQDAQSHPATEIKDLGANCHIVSFSGLRASTDTVVNFNVSRAGSESETVRVSFRTYPAPARTGRVRIAFGSCSKISQYPSGPIYDAIKEESPELMIFLGDNAYFIVADGSKRHFQTSGPIGDWNFPESMFARHLLTRVHSDLQPMFRHVPSYGIWDDHDYGPNNADRTFELKEEALTIFRQMWANPGWGTEETPGIFSSFRCGPAEIFLLDDRYHKYSHLEHKDVTAEDGAIWGEAQLDWLIDKLKQSTAPVKVIANGTQVLCKDGRGEGHQLESPSEYRKLSEALAEHKIGGVVFLSGDRHHSEAMQQRQPDGTLLLEATSSPLQQDQRPAILDRHHENQIWGMRGNNYGLLTIDIPEGRRGSDQGTITVEMRDEENKTHAVGGVTCRTTWNLPQLNYGVGDRGKVPKTWKPIFNGINLRGWRQHNGTATYRVEDAVLIGRTSEGSPNSFLCTAASYGDFELKFSVKVDEDLNSGVQFRSQSKASFHDGRVHGPQVEIESAPGAAGYVYSEGTGRGWLSQNRTKTDVFQNGDWNQYYVRAEGNRIQTWVNGVAVADIRDDASAKSGFIGLQVHGIPKGRGPYEVRWRDLYVKPMK